MNIFRNIIQLYKEIRLAIALKSFYIKKVFIPDFRIVAKKHSYKIIPSTHDAILYYLKNEYKLEVKKLIKYKKDEARFGYAIWYI